MRSSRIAGLAVAAIVAAWAPHALARPGYFANDCASCHPTSIETCTGCHSHGAEQSSAKNAIGITGQLDKTTYAPGDTITATVTGGYEPSGWAAGWLRVVLLDEGMAEVARHGCPGNEGGCVNDYPVTLTATAPSTAGSHTWAIAWYGNAARDRLLPGLSFGSGISATRRPGYFTEDLPNNPGHGWQTVALPSFTVTGADGGTTTTTTTSTSGGCGSGSGSAGAAAVVVLALLAARRLRRRQDSR